MMICCSAMMDTRRFDCLMERAAERRMLANVDKCCNWFYPSVACYTSNCWHYDYIVDVYFWLADVVMSCLPWHRPVKWCQVYKTNKMSCSMFILGRGETIKGLVSCFISKLCGICFWSWYWNTHSVFESGNSKITYHFTDLSIAY